MKLVSYLKDEREQLGVLVNNLVYDMEVLHPDLPNSMNMFLTYWDESFHIAQAGELMLREGTRTSNRGIPVDQLQLLAPVPFPASCRDGYAFRQHVAAARRNRKVDMIPEFDQYPIFYFTNHHGIQGPGELRAMPDHFEKLDFELEAAIVICRHGRNIPAERADEYIGGIMIMNDMSARRLQMEEMLLNLGPAKGKDFSTVIGPWLVTLDELQAFEIPAKENHTGKSWNLKMKCWVNGVQVSEGNLGDMDWTFAEIIERASYGVDLYPGDVIGSGTVGTGCFLELNGTGKLNDPNYQEQWLQANDKVEMAIDQLGHLSNTIVAEDSSWSILAQKKTPATE
ncbi:MAG: fumarylacetoacetate hydrolase [Sphingobacteriales bacterium SCN 48-20]|jgi:fumarylacetoacetate (FAA) hydrolase|uniref:fumarylacetoacetate hydrolase family protein n=1 Tax=Terrimonas ferruginea TaxID=249 RepID=UPI000414AFAA|nr:fumarylacetoacetate hydrolase family protein [Terrimonas ferruginea]MBN8785037.1 fumarylacetoacetate hydrolase family protein [Terrimonas ferruginea]ODT93810.1 MAG: fumarylacetoacetate hydrolase [Sphingobacteriales bacterium SCN 48-20]OJW43302.1 MAG: fumarylacetoacetate hydrolase [Sphingobacteriales bacterium 48-107]